MAKNIFIWTAHPKAGSLCAAIADAYEAGARRKGANIRRMDLSDMQFDMNVDGSEKDHALDPDLLTWQENVTWADHLLIVHPYWWGAMPAKAKAVLDRALASGFAYKYRARGVAWDKLLKGKTADAIVTSDTPPLLDTLIYWRPGRHVIKNQVLDFCGIKPRKILQFGSVKLADAPKIQRWLGQSARLGARAAA